EARDHTKTDNQVIALRDAAQDIERSLELTHSHAKSGLDYSIAKCTEDAARASEHVVESGHRLNMIAATFLPISAIAALFSMQIEHGLEHVEAPYVFWGIAAFSLILGLVVRSSV